MEGLVLGLDVFLGKSKFPDFKRIDPPNPITITVEDPTQQIRPFVVGCVLRDITFDESSLQSFIDLQEILHHNICRRRTLVAIGTHDLDTLKPPFRYTAQKPEDISFIPLKQTQKMNGRQLMEFYDSPTQAHIRPFLPIIRDSPVYPVIYDSQGTVCSLPPIINGEHSKVTLSTKNVFIESTATDLTKAKIVLNTIVSMFSQYCKIPFSVEAVQVQYSSSSPYSSATNLYPQLHSEPVIASVAYINRMLGLQLTGKEMAALLPKMMVPARVVHLPPKQVQGQAVSLIREQEIQKSPTPLTHEEQNAILQRPEECIECTVTITRSDLLHACDIVEDVAVAYGFNSVPQKTPKTNTFGKQQPLNRLTDALRLECAFAGFTEYLTFGLCSVQEAFDFLCKKNDGKTAVVLANPKTIGFQIVRPTLLPGLLRSYGYNQNKSHLQLFEVSDVCFLDSTSDTGSRNQRRLCAISVSLTDNLETVHGLLQTVFTKVGVPDKDISLVHSNDPMFLKGRGADVFYKKQNIGYIGVLSPVVIRNFKLKVPVCAVEINVEPFVNLVS